jgi:hypothetical protein
MVLSQIEGRLSRQDGIVPNGWEALPTIFYNNRFFYDSPGN